MHVGNAMTLPNSTRVALKLVLAMLPAAALTFGYVAWDPFEVIHAGGKHYRDLAIIYNRDFNSTEVYLHNSQTIPYDSFVFGSSRSWAFLASDWQRYIGVRPVFHFDASGETLFGIHQKVAFLDSRGVRIRNALLVLDYEGLRVTVNSPGHLFIKHPALSAESWAAFHYEFIAAFAEPSFLEGYLAYKLLGREPRDERLFRSVEFGFDPVSNDVLWLGLERELLQDPADYYRRHAQAFPPRDQSRTLMHEPVIREPNFAMLADMANVFQRHGTEVRVVLSPLYDQVKMNPWDVSVLQRLFGDENVFDYSGANYITNDMGNYYEPSHYRVQVGSQILAQIYGNSGHAR